MKDALENLMKEMLSQFEKEVFSRVSENIRSHWLDIAKAMQETFKMPDDSPALKELIELHEKAADAEINNIIDTKDKAGVIIQQYHSAKVEQGQLKAGETSMH